MWRPGPHGFLVTVTGLALRIQVHPARTRLNPWLFVVPAGLVLTGIVCWLINWRLGVDSAVYRSGAVALLHGEPLYDSMSLSAEPPWARLPFTYPPTAALLFAPLALFPTQVS